MIVYDPRWAGPHGIGRFAKSIMSRIPAVPLPISGNPAAPLDSIGLSRALWGISPKTVFFSPGYSAPLIAKIPFVFTIHDLNHIDRPENSSLAKRIYYATLLKSACHRAARILTVSSYSAQRILEWSGVSDTQIVNVGNGVDPQFDADIKPYEPGYPYFFCVGNRKLHKNEQRTMGAFSIARIPKEIKLIFSGDSTPALKAEADERGIGERVVFTGKISDIDLPSYYKGAIALLFASLYEGFGLPVLEAMACGTPVVTSNVTALPEVAGGAALLVNPESTEEISGAIERVIEDSALRAKMIAKGFKQAAQYSWDETAGKVREVLRGVNATLENSAFDLPANNS